jgi:hypothetical protein
MIERAVEGFFLLLGLLILSGIAFSGTMILMWYLENKW